MKLNTLFEGFSKQIYSKSNESSDDDSALAAASTKTLLKIENEKYRLLLDDLIEWKGHKLYRIQYKKKIVDSDGFATRPGKLGGYIESLDNLDEKGKCVVLNNAKVWGNAKVYDNAYVYGHAQVYDNAQVYGDALVHGHALVYDHAQVYTKSSVFGDTQVYGDAKVHSLYNKWICVYGKSEIYGDADVCNNKVDLYMDIEDKKINH